MWIILLLIFANGLFAMSEIAIVTARKPRLRIQAEKGNSRAAAALRPAARAGDHGHAEAAHGAGDEGAVAVAGDQHV